MKKLLAIMLTFGVFSTMATPTAHANGHESLIYQNGVFYKRSAQNGVDYNYTGLTYYRGNWFYVQRGQLHWGYTGLVLHNGNWFYTFNSQVDWNYTGLVLHNGNWFYVQRGQLHWGYTGLVLHNGNWFYVSNSQVNWNYTGLVLHNGNWFYVQRGQLHWGYNGVVQHNGGRYYVSNSQVNWTQTRNIQNNVQPSASTGRQTQHISQDQVRNIATKHTGVGNLTFYAIYVTYDDDYGYRPVYHVDARANGWEYDLDIDAATGRVLSFDRDHFLD